MRTGKLKLYGVAAILIGLSACQTTQSRIGEGIISLEGKLKTGFNEYIDWDKEKEKGTTAFAISRISGAYGSSNNWGGNDEYNSTLKDAIKYCGESDCKIYAVNGKVVWKNIKEAISTVKIGQGAIELSERAKKYYKDYQNKRPANQRSVFSVNSTTQSGYMNWGKDLEAVKLESIEGCNASAAAKGARQDCAIYDIDGKVVWDFSAAPSPNPAPSTDASVEQQLTDLNKLLEKGLITKDEAAAKRKAILDNM